MKEDEREAFRLLFAGYYDPLLLYCHRILGDPVAAEDVVQECFISLWRGKRLAGFVGDLDKFLFRVAKNRALVYLRDKRRADHSRDSYLQEQPPGEEEYRDNTDALYLAINRLPEKCRKIFLMACLDDKTYQQVADELHLSVNTVKSQMKYALKFLRENLDASLFLTILMYLTPGAFSRNAGRG
ncbi:MAG: RNA polymerase sigma-70 factor [Odoribacteraceae bacterium]|jgi:RNA polymerase sigma-70 factor (ECF subfamily)|nr:RNA polymerase sigma-70 factor [Odoribacteraceae bacterium]